jgi:hypothetical protein
LSTTYIYPSTVSSRDESAPSAWLVDVFDQFSGMSSGIGATSSFRSRSLNSLRGSGP